MSDSARPTPTRQQLDAIDARGTSVVLSSGAGCGKTFVLTNRYLTHLKRDGVDVGGVVAITFTDRAARQMRDKIRKAVARELAENPKDTDWIKHLRDLEPAPIQTIHSFCGNLLRQFAVAAGIDPQFEVLEEVLSANLRAEALRDTLHELLTSKAEAGIALQELVVLFGWFSTLKSVEHLLNERDTAAWTRWLQRSPQEITSDWVDAKRDDLKPEWMDYLINAAPKVAHLVNLFRSIPCLGTDMQGRVQTVLEGLPRLVNATDLEAAVEELCEAAKVGTDRAKAWPDAATYEAIKKAMADFRSELPNKLALFMEEPTNVEESAVVGQRFLRVALAVSEAFQERKRQAGVLDFQDLLVMARDLVRDNANVRNAVLHRYHYLLLDEMQDTDPVQMELVDLICGIGIEHDKLFAVGDAKQSIYMFRGAEVGLFEQLRAKVGEKGRLSLTRNYRSQPAILHFVNALCGKRFANYEPLEPHHPQAFSGACVEFLWSMPLEGEDKETAGEIRAREADAIARRIAELIASPVPRILEHEKLRSVRAGDIVLLFRSMSNVALYEAALRKHGLDYYLVGGRAFFAQQEIYDLLNLLRALENPDDSVALAGTLRSPFACLSDDTLLLLGLHPEGLWAGLNDGDTVARLPDEMRPRAERIRTLLSDWREVKDRLPIARLIDRFFADTGYDAAMQFEFLGDRKLANLWKLVDLARGFDRPGLFGLAEFIARLGDLVSRQPREEQAATQPENADVIRIMSIHQAKGLEFPVVFVPDLAATSGGGQFSAARWDRRLGCLVNPPDEEPPLFSDYPHRLGLAYEEVAEGREDLRILYVACTRARDLLVLSAGLKEPLPADSAPDRPVPVRAANVWMLSLGEQFHLRSGECLDSSVHDRPRVDVRIVTPVVGLPESLARRDKKPEKEFNPPNLDPIVPSSWPAVVLLSDLEQSQPVPSWDLVSKPPRELAKFAATEWPARIRAGHPYLSNVEFLCPWPDGDGPVLKGWIDYVWKEPDGWHVLLIKSGDEESTAGRMLKVWLFGQRYGEELRGISQFNALTGLAVNVQEEVGQQEVTELLRPAFPR